MMKKGLHDREGKMSSKRIVILMAAVADIVLAFLMGLIYMYGLVVGKDYDVAGIISLCGLLSGLITLLATIGSVTKT